MNKRIQNLSSKCFRLGLTLFACALTPSQADTFFQTTDDTSDSGPNWTDAIWGAGPDLPTSGNDYISDGNTVTQLRTGNSGGTSSFTGDTLTLRNGVTFVTKQDFQADIFLESGGEILAGDSDDMTGGSLTIQTGQSGIYNTGSSRNIELGANVYGGGDFSITNSGTFSVQSTNNTFSGNWILDGGISFAGQAGQSLGTGSFVVNNGTIRIDYSYDGSSTGSTLVLNPGGVFDLGASSSSHTFDSVTLDGDSLSAGTYSYNDLTPSQQAFFIDGTDTITVIPEPSTLTLLGISLLLASLLRRNKKA